MSAPPGRTASIGGWGGGQRARVTMVSSAAEERLRSALEEHRAEGAIARGMGRSYGDAAQLAGGLVLDTTALSDFELDPELGIVDAQAGVTFGRLLSALEPAGWVLPVVPGTQHVTVGGAIACDIHGKNHGVAGTFGAHVQSIQLLTADGELRELTRRDRAGADGTASDAGTAASDADDDYELFDATIGGMGLTGLIISARFRLRRLASAMLTVDTDRIETLNDALDLLDGPGGPHRVAWLDLLGRQPVRGVVTRADETDGDGGATTVAARFRIPPQWPAGILRPGLVRAHNAFRFHSTPRRRRAHPEPFGTHMFPLDVLDAWPRLYGPAGFVQYQLVVPRGREAALERVIARLRGSGAPCYLAVLKDFGAANGAPLSFPIEGWTLALDLPAAAPGLGPLLDSFDDLVAEAGGRIYLAKDGRMRADALAAMYPRLEEWRAVRDRVDPDRLWRSDLGLRTGLVEVPR